MTDVIREEPSAPLYPVVSDGESFRLQKINMILSELGAQVKHYESVRKKYNKTRSVTNTIALSSGTLSAILTTSGIASGPRTSRRDTFKRCWRAMWNCFGPRDCSHQTADSKSFKARTNCYVMQIKNKYNLRPRF